VTFALAVLHAADRVLVERRPPEGMLGGMWSFPEREITDGAEAEAAVRALAADRALHVAGEAVALPACRHEFTHLHATYVPWALAVTEPRLREGESTAWIAARGPVRVALPTAQRRVLASFLRPID
jgi:A/G-specific adenine glycosylase